MSPPPHPKLFIIFFISIILAQGTDRILTPTCICGRVNAVAYIVQPCTNFSEINYLCIFGRGHGHLASLYGTAESSVSIQLERGYAAWCEIQTKWRSSVVGERFCEAVLASLHPWQSPDCIPIVGSAKSLVPNDKRFNHTKVWCTFTFIDLQATSCVSSAYTYYKVTLKFPTLNSNPESCHSKQARYTNLATHLHNV